MFFGYLPPVRAPEKDRRSVRWELQNQKEERLFGWVVDFIVGGVFIFRVLIWFDVHIQGRERRKRRCRTRSGEGLIFILFFDLLGFGCRRNLRAALTLKRIWGGLHQTRRFFAFWKKGEGGLVGRVLNEGVLHVYRRRMRTVFFRATRLWSYDVVYWGDRGAGRWPRESALVSLATAAWA